MCVCVCFLLFSRNYIFSRIDLHLLYIFWYIYSGSGSRFDTVDREMRHNNIRYLVSFIPPRTLTQADAFFDVLPRRPHASNRGPLAVVVVSSSSKFPSLPRSLFLCSARRKSDVFCCGAAAAAAAAAAKNTTKDRLFLLVIVKLTVVFRYFLFHYFLGSPSLVL